ncbi:uroporphyrinogen-III synthase [Thalassobacillus sp. CUG 92003]|uniref:uroporphyrinogen-III synthase n=1 Tax=Thalassobacillus sp. CUG 92003 TaxID=2736641 RepID=UPI0015E6C79C|nr:uroporphyrinogen-III synthase [Thalassobacillus sp. CUG 92003]
MSGLMGKRIMVTRASPQAEAFSHLIQQHGGDPVEVPLLTFRVRDNQTNRSIMNKLHAYTWLFFTSSNGVKFFFDMLDRLQLEVPHTVQFAVVGRKTEQALDAFGYTADFIPDVSSGAALGSQFALAVPESGKGLVVCGNLSRGDLAEELSRRDVFFHQMIVYDTITMENHAGQLQCSFENGGRIDGLTFTSPSTIQAFMDLIGDEKNDALALPCFCIGPTTANEAEQKGFQTIRVPTRYTIESMIDCMNRYFN